MQRKRYGEIYRTKSKEYSKVASKTFKNLNFRIECIPDIKMETPIQKIEKKSRRKLSKTQIINLLTILRNGLKNLVHVPDIFKEARERYIKLEDELHTSYGC